MRTLTRNLRRAPYVGAGLVLSSISCLALACGTTDRAVESSQESAVVSVNQFAVAPSFTISSILSQRMLLTPPIPGGASPVRQLGVASATPGKNWNLWGNLVSSGTEQDFTRPQTGVRVANHSDGMTSVIGGDYALSPRLVTGVSASFDRTSGVSFENGANRNEILNKGFMIAPYLGYRLSKQMALDVSFGLGQGTLSQTGNVSADADRFFAAANLSYSDWLGNTQISGKLGYMHAEEEYGMAKRADGSPLAGTANTNKIDQVRMSVQAGWWKNNWMPYVGLAYATDVDRSSSLPRPQDPIGRDAMVLSLGANFFSLKSGFNGGIAFLQEFGRTASDNQQLVANIGIRF